MVHRSRLRRWFAPILYQVTVYCGVQFVLRSWFAENVGVGVWVQPVHNLDLFLAHPLTTLLHVSIAACLVALAARGWDRKPRWLRRSFVWLSSVLFVQYVLFGDAFEVRVFWEVYPVVALLAVQHSAISD